MKVHYECEVCGKVFTDESKAKACEYEHKRAAKEKELADQKESKLLDAINSAVNLYIKNYGKMPYITLTEENEKKYWNYCDNLITEILNLF